MMNDYECKETVDDIFADLASQYIRDAMIYTSKASISYDKMERIYDADNSNLLEFSTIRDFMVLNSRINDSGDRLVVDKEKAEK